jgi:hypothetical protein
VASCTERMGALVELLTGPAASISEQLRAAMAIGGVSVGWMFFADQVPDRAAAPRYSPSPPTSPKGASEPAQTPATRSSAGRPSRGAARGRQAGSAGQGSGAD